MSLLHDVIVVTWRRDVSLLSHSPSRSPSRTGCERSGFRSASRRGPDSRRSSRLRRPLCRGRLGLRGWRATWCMPTNFRSAFRGSCPQSRAGHRSIISEHWSALALGQIAEDELARARRIFRHAAVVSPVSDDLGRHIAPLTGDDTAGTGIESCRYQPLQLAARAPRADMRLLAVGNLKPVKAHRVLIDAMALLVETYPISLSTSLATGISATTS